MSAIPVEEQVLAARAVGLRGADARDVTADARDVTADARDVTATAPGLSFGP